MGIWKDHTRTSFCDEDDFRRVHRQNGILDHDDEMDVRLPFLGWIGLLYDGGDLRRGEMDLQDGTESTERRYWQGVTRFVTDVCS